LVTEYECQAGWNKLLFEDHHLPSPTKTLGFLHFMLFDHHLPNLYG
jgi:hypothetical protein